MKAQGIVESSGGGTFRAVYTVKFEDAVYVLHCFQKKSKHRIATPKPDMDMIMNDRRRQKLTPKEIRSDRHRKRQCRPVVANADEMQVKAQLATKIGEIIKTRKWTQLRAAEILGMTQTKLSKMRRGQFRDISEVKMLDCLTRIGCAYCRWAARRRARAGRAAVAYAA